MSDSRNSVSKTLHDLLEDAIKTTISPQNDKDEEISLEIPDITIPIIPQTSINQYKYTPPPISSTVPNPLESNSNCLNDSEDDLRAKSELCLEYINMIYSDVMRLSNNSSLDSVVLGQIQAYSEMAKSNLEKVVSLTALLNKATKSRNSTPSSIQQQSCYISPPIKSRINEILTDSTKRRSSNCINFNNFIYYE